MSIDSTDSSFSSELTDEQRQKAVAWLNSKSPLIGKCSICGDRRWGILDDFIQAPVFHPGGGVIIGGKAYPCFGIMCANCGNTHFINALVSGLIGGAES